MKKAALVLISLAAATGATTARADEPADEPTNRETATPLEDGATATPPAGSEPPRATTTITSAEPPAGPVAPVAPPRERETIVARQAIRPHRPLLLTGTSMFVGSYATTAALTAVTASRGGNADKDMYLPVVGPWLHLVNVYEGTFDKVLIAGSGVIQGAGLAIGVASLFIPEKIPAATIEARGIEVNLTATTFGRGSAGLGAVGRF